MNGWWKMDRKSEEFWLAEITTEEFERIGGIPGIKLKYSEEISSILEKVKKEYGPLDSYNVGEPVCAPVGSPKKIGVKVWYFNNEQ